MMMVMGTNSYSPTFAGKAAWLTGTPLDAITFSGVHLFQGANMNDIALRLMRRSHHTSIPDLFMDFFDDISLAYMTIRIARSAPLDESWFTFNPYIHMERKEAERALGILCELGIVQMQDDKFWFDADAFYGLLAEYVEAL